MERMRFENEDVIRELPGSSRLKRHADVPPPASGL
jgi:hypothetical protein